jgi:hypothetical protein
MAAVCIHSARAISPHVFNRMAPLAISPNNGKRWYATIVTKYVPGWV